MKLVVKTARNAQGIFRAWCPALPGCVVLGQSLPEVREKIRQAVVGYLCSLDVALPRELSRLCMSGRCTAA